MNNFPGHHDQLTALKRIEGQIRGINKMVEERKYCVDIVNQIHAAANALHRVAHTILGRHIETCVASAIKGKSVQERQEKINEILSIIQRINRLA